jgi:hypothetical protein
MNAEKIETNESWRQLYDEETAFSLAQSFHKLKPEEHSAFFVNYLHGRIGSYLCDELRRKGAFVLQLDISKIDEIVWKDIRFLLDSTNKLDLSPKFKEYLNNILGAEPFYKEMVKQRDKIDAAILGLLSACSFEDFVRSIFHRIKRQKAGKGEIYWNEKGIKKRPIYIDAVAAATYLIHRGQDLSQSHQENVSSSHHKEGMKGLFEETCLYLFHQQELFKICYFGNTFTNGLLQSSATFSDEALETSAGIRFEQMMEQEDMSDKEKRFRKNKDIEKWERHLITEEAKVLGIPEKDYLQFRFFKSLSFADIALFQKCFSVSCFFEKKNFVENKKDLRHYLESLFADDTKIRALMELLITKPSQLVDLFQTPFVEIGHQLFWSKTLFFHENLLRNTASRAAKLGQGDREDKGNLFQDSIAELLQKDGWKVAEKVPIKMVFDGKETIGDIDVIAAKNNTIYFFECKSDLPAQDYFDFRRNNDNVEKAMVEIHKGLLFAQDPNGKMVIEQLMGQSLNNKEIKGAMMSSNCRSSCKSEYPYPIYSVYELKSAINLGTITLVSHNIQRLDKPKTMPEALEEKFFPRLIKESLEPHTIKTAFFIKKFVFDDYNLDMYSFSEQMTHFYAFKIPLRDQIGRFFYTIGVWRYRHPIGTFAIAFLILSSLLALLIISKLS